MKPARNARENHICIYKIKIIIKKIFGVSTDEIGEFQEGAEGGVKTNGYGQL